MIDKLKRIEKMVQKNERMKKTIREKFSKK
jgi:hypothetical protein